jgi:anaerobic ribonucleoside-triphosphate reductase activating protein
MKMRIAGVNPRALTDGPGLRFSIFVQGCSIRCKGCQVPHLWDFDGGQEVDVRQLSWQAGKSGLPVTIVGGEPFDQVSALGMLVYILADNGVPVTVYTGYTLEQLLERARMEGPAGDTWLCLTLLDTLVDGPFIQDQDDDRLQYRGSRNQRIIDVPRTLAPYVAVSLSETEPPARIEGVVQRDWDTPEVILTPEGHLLATEGLAAEFAALGQCGPARRCGQIAW